MILPQRFLDSIRTSVALRRVAPAALLACVLTLHWAVAQTAPGAPSGLAATAGNRTIALTWDDPGDETITGYEYRLYANREPDWREWKQIAGSTHGTTSHALPGLTNRVGYRVEVRAVNDAGPGAASEAAATPSAPEVEELEAAEEETAPAADAPPAAPVGLAATAGDGTVALTWDDPGDATITGYEYRVYATGREQDWREWKEITGTTSRTTGYTLTLTNDVAYRVQLRARNSAGAGAPSEVSGTPQAPAADEMEEEPSGPPADAPPAAPVGLAATAGDRTIALTWDDPEDATITGYEYRVYADREDDWREWKRITRTTSATTEHTLTLTNGVSYRVQLRARNSAGEGEPSETSGTPQSPEAATDTPAAAESAVEPAAGETPMVEVEESPRSGAPWIVIIVLAVCLVAGIVLVATRMRRPAGGSADSSDADSAETDSADEDSADADPGEDAGTRRG